MKRTLKTLLCALLAVSGARSAHAGELDRAAAALAGSEAQFTQSFTPKGFSRTEVESGTVTFGTLPMMRWEYQAPEQKLFVFDGVKSWLYVPADKQVTIAELDDDKRAALPFLLISDPNARSRSYDVRESSSGRTRTVTLDSKVHGSLIRNIRVTVDGSSHAIQKVEYSDREGNQTVFAFSGMHKKVAGRETFQFTPPADAQVVTQ